MQQPWAWLLAAGIKDIENRTWPTRYRGVFYIHASKRPDPCVSLRDLVQDRKLDIDPDKVDLNYGGIIGRARIVSCIDDDYRGSYSSDWYEGPYGFVIRKPELLDFHPCRGRLGFFEFKRAEDCRSRLPLFPLEIKG